ncbi:hypothetical protein HU200_020032 [Digitaria exilis]|uniref:Gnk2-homologous domain-containing protein n=1 Tax=Digitaria exilis TaxID=1010633 RepID=A0A835F183_9POAL|nr:hypothetical protein HU200_020032 [Digitaria exilis]
MATCHCLSPGHLAVVAAAAFFLLAAPALTLAQEKPPPWLLCGPYPSSGNYSANSTYQSNIQRLSLSLPNNTSSTPALFATGVAGAVPDAVYALALCRGDIANASACESCVAMAFADAQARCPLVKDVLIFYDLCQLRFSNRDFFPDDDNVVTVYDLIGGSLAVGEPAAPFDAAVRRLANATADYAAERSSSSSRWFATGEVSLSFDDRRSNNSKIYAVSQCTPEKTAEFCRSCLGSAIDQLPTLFSGRNGGGVYPFFSGQPLLQLEASMVAAPAPAPALLANSSQATAMASPHLSHLAGVAAATTTILLASLHARAHQEENDPPPWLLCSGGDGESGNYTANSTYQANIRRLSSTLPKKTSSTPSLFARGATGSIPDRVYALAACRGDVANASACESCVAMAFHGAQRRCPLVKDVLIFYELCMIRFSNRMFFLDDDNFVTTTLAVGSRITISGGGGAFDAAVLLLVNATANYAAERSSSSSRWFATGEQSNPTGWTIYALSQCTPDKDRIVGQLSSYFSGRSGGGIFGTWCFFRYEADAAASGVHGGGAATDYKSSILLPSPSRAMTAMSMPTTTTRLFAVAAILLVIFFLHAPPPPAAAQPIPWQLCNDTAGNFTENSAYQANIRHLATTIPTNASSSPFLFATGIAGTSPDVVYALALCRGDTTNASACSSCVAAAFDDAQQLCALIKGATIYDDPCILRYADWDFLANTTDNRGLMVAWSYDNVSSSETKAFDAASARLVNATSEYAAASRRRFGTGEEEVDDGTYPKIYSLAQCTPDMAADDCRTCLGKHGGRVFGVRCSFRFETSPFFSGQPLLQLAGPPPPPVNVTPPVTGQAPPLAAAQLIDGCAF